MDKENRLFVPVTSEAYSWFEDHEKSFELRRDYGRFRSDRMKRGRWVEIRRGYSGDSIWGKIGRVITGENLREILKETKYSKVIPVARDLDEAVEIARSFVGDQGPYVLFEILDHVEGRA